MKKADPAADNREIKKVTKEIMDLARDPDDTSLDRPAMNLQGSIDDYVNEPRGSALDPSTIPIEEYRNLSFIKGGEWRQDEINAWQSSIFGLSKIDPLATGGIMEKIEEEVAELRRALEEYRASPTYENGEKVRIEMADVAITNFHLAGALGVRLQNYVDQKMNILVQRKWAVNSAGSGRHIEE